MTTEQKIIRAKVGLLEVNDYITCRVNSVDLKNRLGDVARPIPPARPAQLHLPCEINSAHGAGEPNVREDHGDLTPADQHDRKRGFRAFTLDGVHFSSSNSVEPPSSSLQADAGRSDIVPGSAGV